MGVLQRLAICYLVAALVYRALVSREPSDRIVRVLSLAGVLLLSYWVLLTFVAAPGGVAGDLSPSGNLGAWIDRTVFTEAHLWRQSRTWDPEGLLSTLPAVATALTGVAAGVVLTIPPTHKHRSAWLAAAGAAALVLGLAWNWWFPINKNLWTSSYVLFTSGLAAIALAAAHVLIDARPRPPRWTRPFIVLGMNALTLFVVSGLLVKTLTLVRVPRDGGTQRSLYVAVHRTVFAPLAPPKVASLLFACAALALLYGFLELLFRRRWFLKA
jgi:predicted acyltransferase